MENNVTMVAYSPFAQGLLTGKYKVRPGGSTLRLTPCAPEESPPV